jgi:hypothetical protein
MGVKFADQYSLLHFASGVTSFYWNISLVNWIIIHTIFEIFENTTYGMYFIDTYLDGIWPGGKKFADAPINSIGDTVFAILGWIFAKIIFEKITLLNK